MTKLFQRLSLSKRLALLGVIGFFLMVLPFSLYVHDSWQSITNAKQEAQGIAPSRLLLKLVQQTQQHRGMSNMLLSGNLEIQGKRQEKMDEVNKTFTEVETFIKREINNTTIDSAFALAKKKWVDISAKVTQRTATTKESFVGHTDAIGTMLDLSAHLQDHYHLTFDPTPDGTHLIGVALVTAPALTESFGQIRAKGAGILAAKTLGNEDRIAFIALLEKAGTSLEKLQSGIEKASAANPETGRQLSEQGKQTLDGAQAAKALALTEIINKDQLSFSSSDYFNRYTVAIDVQFKLIDASMQILEQQLNARVDRLYKNSALLSGAVLALALIAAFIGTRITRGLLLQMGGEPEYASEIANKIASGDLTATIVTKAGDTSSLLYAMQQMQHSLVSIVNRVRVGTDTIATASAQIAAGNQDLSSRTEQQASSLEETASAMEELTSTVRQNGDSATQANQLAISASDIAVKGGAVVSQVVTTMNGINESSKKMSDIISVIDGIAFQTNILALNAAVEAARAGEQGRGFAVVATEVRNLAQRSAAAAREIKTLIDDSVDKVQVGSQLVEQAGTTMEEIVSSIRRVTDIMGEITAATREQVDGIEQVNQAVSQMDQVTQQNAALVEEAAAAAESMQDQAVELVQVVGVFNTGRASSASKPVVSAIAKVDVPPRVLATSAARHVIKKASPPPTPKLANTVRPTGSNSDDWEEF